ncbi:hypothetical protein PsYK624_080720 [Phanerochaete sordida]|uniref:Uncharacterized protein n=1 Tax=Phanerochaete sordida TaxID=48140 RepID=A0A9P3GDQ4_9APHY|nr:hypothetical protein PsYK624_080720 [Phanerochaete sordida]
MSTALIPNEILDPILEHLLFISHTDFLQPRITRFANTTVDQSPPIPRNAHLLLVCKLWLSVGERHLYACVRLASRAQIETVAALVCAHPALGLAIRCLRLEGGDGPGIADIARRAPNLLGLCIDVEAVYAADTHGLADALPLLHPVELALQETTFGGEETRALRALINEHIEGVWTSLRSVVISDDGKTEAIEPIRALGRAIALSNVEEIHCLGFCVLGIWIRDPPSPRVFDSTSLRRVWCAGPMILMLLSRSLQSFGYGPEVVNKFTCH